MSKISIIEKFVTACTMFKLAKKNNNHYLMIAALQYKINFDGFDNLKDYACECFFEHIDRDDDVSNIAHALTIENIDHMLDFSYELMLSASQS
jgi:hypothetical protein